jgi:predicted lipase
MKNINISGYEHYLISKDGRIFNTLNTRGNIIDTPKELKSYPNKNTTYLTAVIRNKFKPKAVYIHRLVAETYIEKPSDLHTEVNHKNFNKLDNRVENLEWVTRSRNGEHMREIYGSKHNNFVENLLKNERLIRVGIKIYNITQDLADVSDIWDCNQDASKKVLDRLGVKRRRYKSKLAIFQLIEIKKDIQKQIEQNEILGKTTIFKKDFMQFLISKYQTKFRYAWLCKIKSEVVKEMEFNKK